ncbi:MAG TPA: UbiD family decarboxylase [Candidatus Acidoferrales bacterium]|nr:UbiD family decarboxylase [Candidatus Acidoferrales bacterium]
MKFNDLREYIAVLEQLGELRLVENASCDLEIGAITEVAARRENSPAVLFDSIQGFQKGYRVLTNLTSNRTRERLVFGVANDMDDREAVKYWKERLKGYKPIPPREVGSGPVKENVMRGEDVDLGVVPWVRWHERDGGPYMCATSVVTRDPDSGFINVGSYRFMWVNKNTMVAHIGSGHHGDVIRKKYWAKGKACPAAISLGQDPALLVAAGTNLPWGSSEYGFAGWLRGEPVEVTRGEYTGLPIPATAEVVLEGDMLPPEAGQEIEGPFGEFSGYYGGGARPAPVTKIHSVLFRKDPIVLGAPPLPPGENYGVLSSRAILIWNELEALGIPNIMGVNYSWGLTIISLKQAYPGHAMRAAHGALGGTAGYHGRFVVLVDDDIDPYNLQEVWWAIATRCDPETSLDLSRRTWSYKIDPRLSEEKKNAGNYTGSVAIIDACRPYHWMDKFPPTTKISQELLRQTEEKWGKFLR